VRGESYLQGTIAPSATPERARQDGRQ
jgi:hypothetical protein